ncbi:hypothetical protein B9Z55_013504 [Caenorhabditis nigoni]|uniref:Uncharacterized protein n=1 Tax=Caenorhabditis nigoni TaxID=1611254 RepID=A0A2G5U1Z4_9PELO|nr:hypothetical protein B9Z55_013504 [Caenorhabditis nigoni]
MAAARDKYFFAAYRGYYTDGETFLQIVGLWAMNNESFTVHENKLKERGIKLGDFLSASVPMGKPVENFNKMNYKFKVNVDGNMATIEDQEADLEKNENGVLVFRVKAFGSVGSIKQNIPVGKYRINIRATRSSEKDQFNGMKYCADVKEPINSPSSDVVVGTGFANISNKKKEPINSPSSDVVVGTGFALGKLNINNEKKMTAFVHSSMSKGEDHKYFLWICDNHQKSVFSSKTHQLALGHFFEGIFKETPNEKSKWQCVKYMKPADPLLKGEMVANHVVLRTSVNNYKPGDASKNWYPQVHSKHLGKIIDNKKKLSEDCNGREIKAQLCKVGNDYRWVVVDLL